MVTCLFGDLITKLQASGHSYDFDKITKAYLFAQQWHRGQYRKSGEAFINHPVAVATIVATLDLDTDSICAALLHDTVEDCPVSIETISESFGKDVASIVDGLTKLIQISFEDKQEENAENLRKMFFAMSKDLRVIFIKLCDRLHNMRTLSSHEANKQRTIALETMHVYAPLAHRLGIQKIKQELELLALKHLDPIGFDEVKKGVDHKYGITKDFLVHAQEKISENLQKHNIKFAIAGRVKSIYSIYKKMYNQNKSFDEIYDFYAIRIIVDTELECYTVLGLIHDMFNLMPGRFKDYISTPKQNLYRSLHTTVIGRDGIPFEVQIRTWEMHSVAEYGLASHWIYKSGLKTDALLIEKMSWIRTLLETEKSESLDPDEFLRPLKVDIFEDEIFVFTPKGDVINLPHGSIGIDFAYAIHSAVGNKMIGLKVNGKIAPIDTVLQTGQIVEILTSASSKGPSRDWLKMIKTGEAKNKIKQWFKKEKRADNIALAKADVDKEFSRFSKYISDSVRQNILTAIAKKYDQASIDDLLNAIGYGGIPMSKVSLRIKEEIDKISIISESKTSENKEHVQTIDTSKREKKNRASDVIIEGLENCQVKFARCCTPLPGDNIIGFITKGYGISIHKYNCPNVERGLNDTQEKDRWIAASWSKRSLESTENNFEASLHIFANNSISLFADISTSLAEMRVPVLSINSKNNDSFIDIILVVKTKNAEHFEQIISKLKKIPDITSIIKGV